MDSDGRPADDAVLTQYVINGEQPRVRPRPVDRDGLSLIEGRLSLIEAARFVRIKVKYPYEGDSVRYVTTGALRAAGFVVMATPSRRNPIHVSVTCVAEWDEDVCKAFNLCFDPYQVPMGGEDQ